MKTCPISNLNTVLSALSAKNPLFLPVDGKGKDNRATYTRYEDGMVYSTALNTVRSAKDFFFPQTENLVNFKVEGKNIEIIDVREEHEDFIVFGVRACDCKAFDVLDRVFLIDPVDSYYASRREHAIVFTMACTSPAETCFCTTFGIDPANAGGDVACYMTESDVYFDAKTERGTAVLTALGDLLSDCGDDAVMAQKELIGSRMEQLPLAVLSTDAFGGDKMEKLFDDPRWASLSESCLACGTCTYVCPTCQCYDIKDYDTGHGVCRFRCWDSCMYSEFTKMSAGQPRLTQLQRFRQRFMHKLVYYPANNDGLFSCVGCGRCLASCPISMNIAKVMKTLSEEATEHGK